MITIDIDTRGIERSLSEFVRKQEPFARMLTLNQVGGEVLEAVEREIDRSFDRPTRWTKKAFYLRRATKQNLSALIERKSAVGRRFYLEVQSQGGKRRKTGMERLLSRRLPYAGIINTVAPAKGARLNRYGNLSPAQVQRMLSALRVQADAAQNTTNASRKRNSKRAAYFVPSVGHRLSPGVYERKAGARGVKKILNFSDTSAKYQARLDIYKPARSIAKARIAVLYDANLRRALRTAR